MAMASTRSLAAVAAALIGALALAAPAGAGPVTGGESLFRPDADTFEGFAAFNKHPALIFLGDAGSLPIGIILAYMLIVVAGTNLAAALLLSLYTLADPTLTLIRRAARKEPVLSAHRTHFYQRGVSEGLSVTQVTTRIFLLCSLLAALAIVTVLADSLTADIVCLALGTFATALVLFALSKGR